MNRRSFFALLLAPLAAACVRINCPRPLTGREKALAWMPPSEHLSRKLREAALRDLEFYQGLAFHYGVMPRA